MVASSPATERWLDAEISRHKAILVSNRSRWSARLARRLAKEADVLPDFSATHSWKILVYPSLAGRRTFHEEVAVQ